MKTKNLLKKLLKTALPLVLTVLLLAGVLSSCGEAALKVPDCIGVSQAEAEKSLNTAGIKYNVDNIYSDEVEEGIVIDQSFAADSEISADDVLTIMVSNGKQALFPNLVGKTLEAAKAEAEQNGLELVVESENFSDTVKKDCVISQNKKAGEKAEKGDKISVVISKGVETVKVPSVKGEKLSAAKTKLEKAKLKYSVKESYSSSVAKGKVISQTQTGKTVKINTVITLTVSLGAKPQETSQPEQSDDSYDDYSSYDNGSSDDSGSSGNDTPAEDPFQLPTIAEEE
ncbi:MAG: PASTA domain-containing protein [Ruminococcus sp.]|nr:PASTA domain-containing protein [Ruminococcus sp.]